MAKEIAQTKKTAAKLLPAALILLKENGGSMRGADIIKRLSQTIELSDWE